MVYYYYYYNIIIVLLLERSISYNNNNYRRYRRRSCNYYFYYCSDPITLECSFRDDNIVYNELQPYNIVFGRVVFTSTPITT